MLSLQKPYIQVQRGPYFSYGGSQMWARRKAIRVCGCGPVAALDTLLYLQGKQDAPLPLDRYNDRLELLCRKYFPLIEPIGINGLFLAAGMNMLLRENKLPYRASWAFSGRRFFDRMEEMLRQDLPVIFSIGPNFPLLWGRHRLDFYRKSPDGAYIRANSTRAHYVTATGMDEQWIRISSWGSEYYINRSEYREYIKKHSSNMVSNMLLLKKRRFL
jgi:hypothetical protein